MRPLDLRNAIAGQCGFNAKQGEPNKANSFCEALAKQKPYALQVCNAGKMPEDFDSWLKANNDSIDIGGNWTPDRVQANHERYAQQGEKQSIPF